MNLGKKKMLAVRTLKVGKERILFVKSRLGDIKEAITKQDILDLKRDGAIVIKEVQGRKKIENKKVKRGPGNVRRKVKTRKQDYVKLTRKLRTYIREVRKQGKIAEEEVNEIRNRIRNRNFKSLANMKDYIESTNKSSASTSKVKVKAKRSKK